MGALGEFNNALLQFGNTVSNVNRDYAERQAKLDLTTMSINLEKEIKNKMLQLQQSNNYQDWEKEIDNFYNERLAAMSDQNSPYYCRNNFTANAAQQMLEQSRNAYQNKAANMALQKLNEQDVVKVNNAKTDLSNLYTGQEYINRANELDVQLYDKGILSPEQYDSRIKNNYIEGRYNYYAQKLDDNRDAAIKEGKSFEDLWTENVENDKEQLKLYDKGIEIAVDNKVIDGKLKQAKQQQFNARVAEIQSQNAQYFVTDVSDINSDIINLLTGRGNKTANDIITRINIGANKVDTMGGNQLAPGKQREISNWYKNLLGDISEYEKAVKSGNSSSMRSVAVTSFKTMIENLPENFIQAYINGEFSDNYDLEDAVSIAVKESFESQEMWTETKGMTKEEREDWFNKNYLEYGAMKVLNDKRLNDIAKKEYPELAIQLDNLKNEVKKDIIENPDPAKRRFTADTLSTMEKFLLDAAASTGRYTDKTQFTKNWKTMLNACTLNGLDGLFAKRGFIQKENSYIANVFNTMQENDVVFTDVSGKEIWAGGEKTKSLYDSKASEIKNFIEQQLGIKLSSEPEYMKTENDILTVPEFRDKNGIKYHIETVGDKKDTPIIVDSNGKQYEVRDLQAEDKANKKASNANIKETYQAIEEEKRKRREENQRLLTESKELPKKVAATETVTEKAWKETSGDYTRRYYQLNAAMVEINNMIKNKKISDEEFRKKVGITKQEWKDMNNDEKLKYMMS